MSLQVPLNARQQQVLSATVRHYIATAEPVGSEVLVKEYAIGASSATVRNAMGFLEKAGLLYQPHISAGRVPSDSGYRTYVDQLLDDRLWVDGFLQTPPITNELEQLLSDRLQGKSWSIEAIFKGASQILAMLSGQIALITLPLTRTLELKHVQLVRVDSKHLMMIVVMDTYETQSVMMPLSQTDSEIDAEIDEELIEQELRILSNFLNEQLRGRSLSQLQALDWQDLGQEFEVYGTVVTALLQELDRRYIQSALPTQMMVSGIADVLKQPEFVQLQQLQTILHLLEGQQNQLVPLIFSPSREGDRRVMIRIGQENSLEPIRSCTLISTHYNRKSMPIGSVSILGPTRMDYESTIALVEATADYLSEHLS